MESHSRHLEEQTRYVYPTRVLDVDGNSTKVLTAAQEDSWRENGFALVDGILEPDLVDQIRRNCCNEVSPARESGVGLTKDNGFRGILFPSLDPATECVNQVTLHPRIITAAAQLLGIREHEMRLSQSEMWPKFSRPAQSEEDASSHLASEPSVGVGQSPFSKSSPDQRVHIDAFNHYLTFPNHWYKPDCVAMIIYYDNTEITGGGTAIVPREGPEDPAYHICQSGGPSGQNGRSGQKDPSPQLWTPGGRGDLPWIDDRTLAEDYFLEHHPDIHAFRQSLYSREKQVRATPGTILFYRLDTWHRGTPLFPGQMRRIQNMLFKRKHAEWVTSWNAGISRDMYSRAQTVERIIASATMQQRCVLGFPDAESEYWDPYTLAACKARFSKIPGGLKHFSEVEEAVNARFSGESGAKRTRSQM